MSRTKERKRIAKDPFHQQILDALGRHLDPEMFEACMADLLRDVFPGLVPVPGGNDAGMDGAVADGRGEPFPLVCTTGEDARGNLAANLDSFLQRGLSSRKVALVTPRTLTPAETRALFKLAKEKKFTLLQVFERSALANLLYKDSAWCKSLLHLTGSPSALSVVPLSRRPFADIELRGRQQDAAWLLNTSGDRLIVGEPGSGKTYLFSRLIRDGWGALFLVSEDETAIANAVREQDPAVVVVDDAHVEAERLARLRRLRREIQADFEIVASTWPGASAEVIAALGDIPESRVHKLELLPRNEILEIIKEVGVEADEDILRELVSQSSNKPGLAVTIAQLWLQGDWQRILDGTVLRRTTLSLFKGLVGSRAADVLAAFSLGGNRGMSLEAVSRLLELPIVEVKQIASGLSAGGVLTNVGDDALAVKPAVLRPALLREVFFPTTGVRLDYRKLLPFAPKFGNAVEEVVTAMAYGAEVPIHEVRDLVLRSGSQRAWSALAHLSQEDAEWVLESYSGDLLSIAADLLHKAPRATIPKILGRAAEGSKSGEFRPDHPMSILSSWVQDLRASSKEGIRRRKMVGQAAGRFLREGGDRDIGTRAITVALNPTVRGSTLDPGIGNTVIMRSGLLPPQSLREIEPIWEKVRDTLGQIDRIAWQHLSDFLWNWLHPKYSARGGNVSGEHRQVMRAFSERVLRDLSLNTEGSPGLQAGLSRMAAKNGIDLGLQPDPLFDLLYPPQDSSIEARRERESAEKEDIRALAEEWARSAPAEIAARIAMYEKEAQRIGHNRIENTLGLCRALAGAVEDPEIWVPELLRENLRGPLVSPFLERMVELQREGWEQQLKSSLDVDSLSWFALSLILTHKDPPRDLLARALDKAVGQAMWIEPLCLRNEVPTSTLKFLLASPDWETALAAAVGEWCADPQGTVREDVRHEWRAAILRAKTEEYEDAKETEGLQYWLGEILSADALLAFDWLLIRLADPDLPLFLGDDSAFARAVGALLSEQKLQLLEEFKPVPILRFLLPVLIENDAALYRRLLTRAELADYHLDPLEGMPNEEWTDLALAAFDAGYEPEKIAAASLSVDHSGYGVGIDYWRRWDDAFAALEGSPNDGLREVAQEGRRWVRRRLDDAEAREKRVALHGLAAG